MSRNRQLVPIIAVSPLLTWSVLGLQEKTDIWLAIFLVGYPILFFAGVIFSPLARRFIDYFPSNLLYQVLACCSLGFLGGMVIGAPFSPILGGAVGALHALNMWLLASFGPLRLYIEPVSGETDKAP